ncbi:hypothetical protein ACNOYE_33135 [Nannocystaceae bacterium ST9]
MSMSRLGLVTPLCSLLLLGAGACKHPSTRLDLDKLEGDEQAKDDKTGEPAHTLDPLPVERPADLLPVEVALMAEASDPSQVLALFDNLVLIPELDAMRNEVSGVLGGDPFKAGDWAKLGLDPKRSAGAALLEPRSGAFCAWLSVADSKTFDTTVRKVAATLGIDRELTVGEMAGSRVYRFNDEFNIVVRAGVAVFVFVDSPQEAARDFPATIATIDPRESLGHAEGFDWARTQLRAGDDGMIFLAPPKLVDAIVAERGDEAYGIQYAEEQLAEARRNGDAALVSEAEARLAQEQQWQRERMREREAGDALARDLLGPMRAVVFTGDVAPTRIDAQARVLMPSGGLLREIFVPLQSQSPLTTALDEPALFMLDGQVDVQKFLRLIDMFAKADGESLDEIDQEIRNNVGISALSTIVPLFDGRGGIAITRSKPANPKKLDELPKTLGVALQFGLKDAEGTRKVLADLARNPEIGKVMKARKSGWELTIPEWRNVLVDVVGDRLIVSTDKGVAGRVRDAKSGKHALPADHILFGAAPTPAMRMYQDWAWVALVDPPNTYIQTAENMLYDLDAHPTLSRDQAAKVPQSKADKQLRKDLQKVLDELAKLERVRAEREFNAVQAALTELGEQGVQLEVVPDGLTIHGLWQTRGKRGMIEIGADFFAFQMGPSDEQAERDRLNSRAWELASEIRVQRTTDLDAFAAKQAQPTP